jgi:hypothetical protein
MHSLVEAILNYPKQRKLLIRHYLRIAMAEV